MDTYVNTLHTDDDYVIIKDTIKLIQLGLAWLIVTNVTLVSGRIVAPVIVGQIYHAMVLRMVLRMALVIHLMD